jgi:hypothetical protein
MKLYTILILKPFKGRNKMFKRILSEHVDGIKLAEDGHRWRGFVNTVMHVGFS